MVQGARAKSRAFCGNKVFDKRSEFPLLAHLPKIHSSDSDPIVAMLRAPHRCRKAHPRKKREFLDTRNFGLTAARGGPGLHSWPQGTQ